MKQFEFYSQSRKSHQLYCRIFVEHFHEETLWQERGKDGVRREITLISDGYINRVPWV